MLHVIDCARTARVHGTAPPHDLVRALWSKLRVTAISHPLQLLVAVGSRSLLPLEHLLVPTHATASATPAR
eukprot:SAG25_NODE_1766_length_2373_cov_8.505717_2_plen_71_part_00